MLISHKHPEGEDYTDDDYTTYRALIAQTNVRKSPNHPATTNPYRTWKWMHMLGKMFKPMESLPDEVEESDSKDVDIGLMEDTDESTDSGILSPGLPPSPVHTHSHGKAKKIKDRKPFYEGYKGEGVVYLPGDINGLAVISHRVLCR